MLLVKCGPARSILQQEIEGREEAFLLDLFPSRQTSAASSKKQELQKNIYFCFIDYAKVFDCVDQNKLWKILKEMGIPDHLTCLPRNLYADQEATTRKGQGTKGWFQIGKGVRQGCVLSPCIFNLYEDYNMQNARIDES